jgi:hypothetical protein
MKLKTFIFASLFTGFLAFGQVMITGPINTGPGNAGFNGRVEVCGAGFMVNGATSYVTTCQNFNVINGVMNVVVYPTVASGTSYRVRFISNYGQVTTETWVVPATPSVQNRSSVVQLPSVEYPMIALSQISKNGATSGYCIKYDGSQVVWGQCGEMQSFNGRTGAVIPASGDYSSFYAQLSHSHIILDISGLQTALDNKASLSHSHVIPDISGLQTTLDNKASLNHNHNGVYEPVDPTILRSSAGPYNDPSWIGSLSWSKITGTPSGFIPSAHASSHLSTGSDPLLLTTSELATASKTGSGTRIVTAGGVPSNGCAKWLNGNLDTTGVDCGGTTQSNYSQSFVSQSSVTLSHGLNTVNVLATCYDGSNQQIEPNSVTVIDSNSLSVAFAVPQTGRCVVNGTGGSGGSGTGITSINSQTGTSQTLSGGAFISIASASNTHTVSVANTQGSGTRLATVNASPADGCAAWASGTLSSTGAPCGTGGGGSMTAGSGVVITGSTISVDPATVPSYLTGTAALSFSTFSGLGNCEEQSLTVNGAVIGDAVAIGLPSTFPTGLVQGAAWVSTANTVTIRLCRLAGTSTITSQTFRAWVNKVF